MSNSLNRATLIGHVGEAPVIRTTQTGRQVANFSIATNARWMDKGTGELQERTEWHRIVVWSPSIINLLERGLLLKGSEVMVEGEIRTRDYMQEHPEHKGVMYKQYSTEIVLSQSSQLIVLGKRPADAPPMRAAANTVPQVQPTPLPESEDLPPFEPIPAVPSNTPDHVPV